MVPRGYSAESDRAVRASRSVFSIARAPAAIAVCMLAISCLTGFPPPPAGASDNLVIGIPEIDRSTVKRICQYDGESVTVLDASITIVNEATGEEVELVQKDRRFVMAHALQAGDWVMTKVSYKTSMKAIIEWRRVTKGIRAFEPVFAQFETMYSHTRIPLRRISIAPMGAGVRFGQGCIRRSLTEERMARVRVDRYRSLRGVTAG